MFTEKELPKILTEDELSLILTHIDFNAKTWIDDGIYYEIDAVKETLRQFTKQEDEG